MIHPTDDDLLAFVLDTIDDSVRASSIADHVAQCDACRSRLDGIRADVQVISSVRPRTRQDQVTLNIRQLSTIRLIVRMAAIVVLSFAAGYASSRLHDPQPARVTPAYADLSPASRTGGGAAPSDLTGVWIPRSNVESPE